MKIEIEKGITIALTDAQLKEIDEQRKRKNFTIQDLKGDRSYEIALQVLGMEDTLHSLIHMRPIDHKLKTIIKAANYIDNGYEEWIPDFDNRDLCKYIPYTEKKKAGWVLYGVYCFYYASYCPVGFYYMKESTAKTVFNNNIALYNEWLG